MITHHLSRITHHASRLSLVALIRAYRVLISPLLSIIFTPLGFGCRFTPTCSEYALEAVQKLGPWRGSLLAARRICKCHPLGPSGYDPVPLRNPLRASVLECASPLALSTNPGNHSARGLAHSRTSRQSEHCAARNGISPLMAFGKRL